jgi:type IV pilus assembly protein PilC
MATATVQSRRDVKNTRTSEGVDRNNRQVRGESRAASETVVVTNLRRQGVRIVKIKRQTFRGGRGIGEKDITFTRQLATMLKRACRCCSRSRSSPAVTAIRVFAADDGHQEQSRDRLAMSQAFHEHPKYFDALYCNLVAAGETSGMLMILIVSRPTRKDPRDQGRDQSALLSDIRRYGGHHRRLGHHGQVILPSRKFHELGADLPAPTLIVIAMSEFVVAWWWLAFMIAAGVFFGFVFMLKRSAAFRLGFDRAILRFPIIGPILRKARSRAGPARCRRCSPRACRSSSRSTPWPTRRATPSTRRAPRATGRSEHRYQPDQRHGQHQPLPDDGPADDADR